MFYGLCFFVSLMFAKYAKKLLIWGGGAEGLKETRKITLKYNIITSETAALSFPCLSARITARPM